MAALNSETDTLVSHLSKPEYIEAFFRASDNRTSRSASLSRGTPEAGPVVPVASHPLPFDHAPRASPDNASNAAQRPHRKTSALETAEELVRMRAGLDAMKPSLPAPASDHSRQEHLGNGGTVATPREEGDARKLAPADHPTVSTSSEEAVGRHSDVFSADDNSDTITDPDLETLERAPRQQPLKAPASLDFEMLNQGMIGSPEAQGPPRRIMSSNELATAAPADHHPEEGSAPRRARSRPYDPAAPVFPLPFQQDHSQQSFQYVSSIMKQCLCAETVSPDFLAILDSSLAASLELLTRHYSQCHDGLCPAHQSRYAQSLTMAANATIASSSSTPQPDNFTSKTTGSGTKWTAVPRRKRATSNPDIYEIELEIPVKKIRIEQYEEVSVPQECEPEQHPVEQQEQKSETQHQDVGMNFQAGQRPVHDVSHDEEYRIQVLAELAQNFTDKKVDDRSRGETTNRYIHDILSNCKGPNTDPRNGQVDVGFLSGEEAADTVDKGMIRLPIVTEGQQQFRFNDEERPIIQLFRRMEDLTRTVSVQVPSNNFDLPSYETKSLEDVQQRFSSGQVSEDPWNILDLRSPLPPSILPKFLTSENCQLLSRIRDSLLMGDCAERTKASKEEWNEWTELLEWVLMSEGGHNTAPHMDSHGWSTWITIQEGRFGFGWLSRPSDKEQEDWMADPLGYTGGNWRFLILKPGQTVFFPSGTIHFVFRLHAQQTLALGGHLLQWSALERWVQVILNQLRNPNITNEDLGNAPLKYIRNARSLVNNRLKNSRVEVLGGVTAVQRFLALSTEVERHYNKKKKKKSRK